MQTPLDRAKELLLFAEEARRSAADGNHALAVACHRKRLAVCCSESTLDSNDESMRFDIMDDALRCQAQYLLNISAAQLVKDLPLFGGPQAANHRDADDLVQAVVAKVQQLCPPDNPAHGFASALTRGADQAAMATARCEPPTRRGHRPEEQAAQVQLQLPPLPPPQATTPVTGFTAPLELRPAAAAVPMPAAFRGAPMPPPAAPCVVGGSGIALPPAQERLVVINNRYGAAPPPPQTTTSFPPLPPSSSHYATSGPQQIGNPQPLSSSAATATVGGFVTATAQYQADIKAGRAAPPPAKRLGLSRRQPFNAPFPAARDGADGGPPEQQAAPPGSGQGSSRSVTMDAVASAVVGGKHNGTKGGAQRGGDDGDADALADFPPALLNPDGTIPARLEHLEPKLVAQIASEILQSDSNVTWDDIAGLEHAKSEVDEAIVWPLTRPDLFSGLRDPPRGLLLFGPPGTGKTMIARAIASRGNCTFMAVSASSLMSKWVGEGEKLVRCLFAVAAVKQPTVVFVDEIDSLLSMRGEGEMDAVRRVKTEFLVQLDGVATTSADRILIIGATNRPEELDEAARRRMEKRLYIPLPDRAARRTLLRRLLGVSGTSSSKVTHTLSDDDFDAVAGKCEGYSGADVKLLAREASFGPLREQGTAIASVAAAAIRPVNLRDFALALQRVRPSVGVSELGRYEKFNAEFGSFGDKGGDGGGGVGATGGLQDEFDLQEFFRGAPTSV